MDKKKSHYLVHGLFWKLIPKTHCSYCMSGKTFIFAALKPKRKAFIEAKTKKLDILKSGQTVLDS